MEINSTTEDSNYNFYTPKDSNNNYYTPKEEISNKDILISRIKNKEYKMKYKIYEDLTKKSTNCCINKLFFCFNKKIYKINSNTFFYSECYILRYIVLYFVINAILTPVVFYFANNFDLLIIILPPVVLIIAILISCFLFLDIYIVIDSSNFTIKKGAICRRKGRSYFIGEINKIDLESPTYDNEKNIQIQRYGFYLFKSTGEKEFLFKFTPFDGSQETDMESVNEFLNDINSLIK